MKQMNFAAAIVGIFDMPALVGCRENEPPVLDLELPAAISCGI